MKPKYLYHGSANKLVGEKLIPKKAEDLAGILDNSHIGVYASDSREESIAMGVLKSRGVKGSSIDMRKINGISEIKNAIIYGGNPRQNYLYLPQRNLLSF